jgi:hypothetical protein
MYLWRRYVEVSKDKKCKLKEILLGRKFFCDINENDQITDNGIKIKGTVKCQICYNLKYEKWRKFSFKFKRDEDKCNR